MLSHIKDVIGDKAIISTEPFNVDEEKQLISFEVADLAIIIKDVIQTCADCCLNTTDKKAIESLLDWLGDLWLNKITWLNGLQEMKM